MALLAKVEGDKGKGAMPSGLASMMKMFGVDPAQIMEAAKKTGESVKDIAGALERIESKLDRNLKLNLAIAAKLGIEVEENAGRELHAVAGSNGTGKNGR